MNHGAPGFYGKIPAQGDFVRAGIGDPLAQALVRWLEEGTAACYQVAAKIPPGPTGFLFRPAGERRALLGVLRGSGDKVGRHFPLALFVSLEGPELARDWPLAPLAHAPLLAAMAALLAEAETLGAVQLAERARALPAPPADALAAAAQAGRDLANAPLSRASPLLGGPPGPRHYALHTLRSACAPLRAREPARAEVLLDCPAPSESERWLWLSLARQVLGGALVPSFAWREGGRLLLSLGPFPPAALPSLCEPPRDGSKVWPLTTPQESAQAAAGKALGSLAAQVDRPDITAGELVAALAPAR
ncbi:MAG: type VI secretion system-associated protein TagF [Deltaproteobacteria bacterium]|nr:type VI secretion system-associated protein TagF [Deltaproteobacteria bacterium]